LGLRDFDKAERQFDVCWDCQVAEREIDLYTKGWVILARCSSAAEKNAFTPKSTPR
jgi:hypothetical protein